MIFLHLIKKWVKSLTQSKSIKMIHSRKFNWKGNVQFQFKGEVPDIPDGENFQSTTLRRKTGTDSYTRDRETGGRFELSPGNYCIIPTAYYPDEEADFLLRVVTEKPAKSGSVCKIIHFLFFWNKWPFQVLNKINITMLFCAQNIIFFTLQCNYDC